MENYISKVPWWVSFLFIPTFPIAIYFMTQIIQQASRKAQLSDFLTNKIQRSIWLFFGLYLSYTFLLSMSGILKVNTLPPRIFLFTTIPLLIFLFGFIFNKPLYSKILDHIPLQSLVKIHIFRFVGIFFWIALYYKTLPPTFALLAGFGDVLTAIGAIFVSKWVSDGKTWSKKATFVWNIFGLSDIISVITTALIITKQSLESNTQSIIEITKIPFIWIPAFAPAVIIFLHISIFKKLKRVS